MRLESFPVAFVSLAIAAGLSFCLIAAGLSFWLEDDQEPEVTCVCSCDEGAAQLEIQGVER